MIRIPMDQSVWVSVGKLKWVVVELFAYDSQSKEIVFPTLTIFVSWPGKAYKLHWCFWIPWHKSWKGSSLEPLKEFYPTKTQKHMNQIDLRSRKGSLAHGKHNLGMSASHSTFQLQYCTVDIFLKFGNHHYLGCVIKRLWFDLISNKLYNIFF